MLKVYTRNFDASPFSKFYEWWWTYFEGGDFF